MRSTEFRFWGYYFSPPHLPLQPTPLISPKTYNLMPPTNIPQGYQPEMAKVLAKAVQAAYKKYNEPDWTLSLGEFKIVNQYIYAYELTEYVFFGFAASGSYGGQPPYYNIVALRGTQTDEESFYDVYDWNPVPCFLPAGSGNQYGQVSTSLYDFYTGTDGDWATSLADSFKTAVSELDGSYGTWYLGAHSLGGAISAIGALDALVSNSFPHSQAIPQVYTFGGLNSGDADFANAIYQNGIVDYYRVVNLADWVPGFTGIAADTPGYQQPGEEYSFLWNTGHDWANHSLDNIYIRTLEEFPSVIKWGERDYPE
jgi:hypothetical protein